MPNHFTNNPNCSDVLVSKGNTTFVYFYYRNSEGKRKQIVFSKGLNETGVSKAVIARRIKERIELIKILLVDQFFDGKTFTPLTTETNLPVSDLIKIFKEGKDGFVSKKTAEGYDSGLNFFVKYLASIDKSDLKINELNTPLVERYVKHLLVCTSEKTGRLLKRNSLLEYKNKLSLFLNWCVKREYIDKNPFDKADFGTVLKKNVTTMHKALTLEEFQSVIDYFKKKEGDSTITVILLIYFTHLRPSETLRIQMKNIDLEARYIELEPIKYKNRRERKIPIDQPMYEHLKSLPINYNKNPEHFLIGHDRKQWASYSKPAPYRYDLLYEKFEVCKKVLGLPLGVTLYGIKHTASVHEFIHENMSKEQIRVKSGHATIAQTEIYMKGLTDIINVPDYQPRKLKFKI